MKTLILKDTDLNVSPMCLGGANFGDTMDEPTSFQVLDRFMELNGNFIDTANIYGKWLAGNLDRSELIIGKWLKERQAYNKIIVATKGGHFKLRPPFNSRVDEEDIRADLEESLKALGVPVIDFYWLHRDNPKKPIGEILELMETLRKEGKIRYYGGSNYSLKRAQEAKNYAEEHHLHGFYALSNEYSLAKKNPPSGLFHDKTLVVEDQEFIAFHQKEQLPLIPYTSSAHGFFSKYLADTLDGKLKKTYLNETNIKIAKVLKEEASKTGISIYALSQACLMNLPFQVIPVASVSKVSQLDDFEKACDYQVKEEVMKQIAACL
ncbi:MAG: aldo/keto reductase [Bacilli bacterium]|nr:aldo/keto reductase [Bacilli bacterium]